MRYKITIAAVALGLLAAENSLAAILQQPTQPIEEQISALSKRIKALTTDKKKGELSDWGLGYDLRDLLDKHLSPFIHISPSPVYLQHQILSGMLRHIFDPTTSSKEVVEYLNQMPKFETGSKEPAQYPNSQRILLLFKEAFEKIKQLKLSAER